MCIRDSGDVGVTSHLSGPLLRVRAGDLGTQHRLVQVQLTVEFGDHRRLAADVDDGVDAFGVLPDLEGQAALAPDVDALDGAAALADDVEERVDRRGDRAFVEVGIEDEQQLIVTWSGRNRHVHLLWTRPPRSFRRRSESLCGEIRTHNGWHSCGSHSCSWHSYRPVSYTHLRAHET